MRSFLEFLAIVFFVTPKVLWFAYKEEKKVHRLFYKNRSFKKLDLFFHKLYHLKNPYRICKEYNRAKGLTSCHSYGETPLTVFQEMFEKGNLKTSDSFVDLGCGRGRGVFFASSFFGCHSIGVELIPFFCKQAKEISSFAKMKKLQFFCQEMTSFDVTLGSFFYFYALCMEEKEVALTVAHLEKMTLGSKVVSVSFPITEYSSSFSLISSWEAKYPWGKTRLFLHVKK